jgi:hypothetical protein
MAHYIANERLYLDADGKVVKADDPARVQLLIHEGGRLDAARAEELGLTKKMTLEESPTEMTAEEANTKMVAEAKANKAQLKAEANKSAEPAESPEAEPTPRKTTNGKTATKK